jgi:hypothetical protein
MKCGTKIEKPPIDIALLGGKWVRSLVRPRIEDWLSKEKLILLRGWAMDGLTDEQLAANMGIGTSTYYRWKAQNKEIREVLKTSKDVADRQVENVLYKKALSGDTTAIIFWLKNRKPDVWRDRKETQVSGSVQTVPDRLVFDFGNAED